MDHMKLETPDLTAQNIEKIGALFPNCVTETVDENGKPKKAINFDLLRQMLSSDVVEGDEAYEFTWVGKKAAIVEANKPIRKTLRPCPEESKDWDTTENLYIEGDNLEVLKLLQESYLGKVKMIYIDPPYNTGSDSFVYADNFAMEVDEYETEAGLYDEEGNRLFKENNASNPRFHSDWLSVMYSRLMLARNLLTDDGVIFISIDENEVDNLQKICNEIFGEKNYAATFIWTKTSTPPALSYKCRKTVEYVLAYEKKWSPMKYFGAPLDGGDAPLLNTGNPKKTLLFPTGSIHFTFMDEGVVPAGVKDKVELLDELHIKNGRNENDVRFIGEFKWEQATLNEEINNGTYFVIKTAKYSIRFQRQNLEDSFKTPTNFLNIELNKEAGVGTNESAVKELSELGLDRCFDYTKPYSLIETVANMVCKNDAEAIVLDFFSGSGTTAQAVMNMNAHDKGNRRFILVQLPETTDEKSVARKMGFDTICEIGKERIRRAGEKIKEDSPLTTANLDVGFRVFKLADSNMKDVYYAADELDQQNLLDMVSNIKEDRTALDLFFGCLLDWGLPLSMPYHSEEIDGCTVHTYNDGDLIACFDKNIPESVVKEIAKRKPLRAVFRDAGFADSPAKINVFEIFKLYMPEDADDITKRVKVL
ncbi:MAG: site-specific DNA-methyltransferase [Clostridiales bacterium]|nr:site-specific DNA-methyltransferase [Clostridiales bacterium]